MFSNRIALLITGLMFAASVGAIVARPTAKASDLGQAISLDATVPHQYGDWRPEPQAVQVVNPQTQELLGIPPTDDRPHGVFATRSPYRPNPIGLTVVELLGRDGNRLRVRGIDMLDGTPVLDVKPYLSGVPPEKLKRGWLEEKE